MSIGSRYSLTRRLGRYGRPTVLALKDCNFFDSRMRVALTWPFHSGGAGASANGRIKLVRACTAGLRVYTSGSISTLLEKSFRGRRTAHIRPRGETRRMVSPVYELHVASGRGARDAFEPPRVFLMHSRDMPTSFPPRLGSSHAPLPRAWSFSTPLPDRPRTPMPPRGRALLLADACSSSSWRSLSLASSPTTAEPIFSPANMLREELLRPAGTPASASKRSPSRQRSRSPSRTDTRSRGSISSHLYAPCSRHGQARPACRPAAAGAPRGVSRRYSKREITALAEKARRAVLQGSEAEREEQRNLVMSPSQLMPALCAPRSLTV